jgi:hypothetical protein
VRDAAYSYPPEQNEHAFRLEPDHYGAVHETRPDEEVASVVYLPEGGTEITWTDGLQVVATTTKRGPKARRTRLAVTA